MQDPFERFVEVFSIEKTPAFWMWVDLVGYIAHERRKGVTGAVASRGLREVARKNGLYFLNADSQMRHAIKPLIEADSVALDYVGLHPTKRTACGLAEAAAALYNTWIDAVWNDARRRYAEAQKNAGRGTN